MIRKPPWLVIVIIVLAIVGALCLWLAKPVADEGPSPSPEGSAAAPQETNATLTFENAQRGTASQAVAVGENTAMVEVSFTYETWGEQRVITSIESATAEKRTGWHSVGSEVTISEDSITFSEEGSKATVPVTYQASIGVGYQSYDDVVVIDLTAA